MQIVHIIPDPKRGDRHEERFPDEYTPEQILDALRKPRKTAKGPEPYPMQFAYGVIKENPDDDFGVTYLEHPATRVVIGRAENKQFVEIKTIHGPEAKP
jgi:hypothetical protein